jgi:flagellar biosynthesis anti-sigma factor FlgM|tara:strand:- start:4 stop:354 length:351 start_codon:yes stop_codon:yes gene_type:complete
MNDINNQYRGPTAGKANGAVAQPANKTQGGQQQSQAAQSQPLVQQTKTGPNQGADQVKLTPEAQTLLHMTQASKGISDVNQTKVNSIKQALEIGEFPINTARVAEKMTSLEKLIQG